MVATASNFPSCEKSNAEEVVSVNSQYESGLYFVASSLSFFPAEIGSAEDERDLCILRQGGGILEACPWPLV